MLTPQVQRARLRFVIVASLSIVGCAIIVASMAAIAVVLVDRVERTAAVVHSTKQIGGLTGAGTSADPLHLANTTSTDYYATFGGINEYIRKRNALNECPPDAIKAARDGEWFCDRGNNAIYDGSAVKFREMEIVDGHNSLAPDPATQCRRTVRDGTSKIVGTYLGECGSFNGDLMIIGFEPAR